jgi:selenocysteine-specific translation elongation factor
MFNARSFNKALPIFPAAGNRVAFALRRLSKSNPRGVSLLKKSLQRQSTHLEADATHL